MITAVPLFFFSADHISPLLNELTYLNELLVCPLHNHSENAEQMNAWLKHYRKYHNIKAVTYFKKNICHNAFIQAYEEKLFPISQNFILLTDGDVRPGGTGWLEALKDIHYCDDQVMAAALNLSYHNLPLETFPESTKWVPRGELINGKYIRKQSGLHMALWRTDRFQEFMIWRSLQDKPFTDASFAEFARIRGYHWAVAPYHQAVHMNWDAYANREHPYTKLRLSEDKSIWTSIETCEYERF